MEVSQHIFDGLLNADDVPERVGPTEYVDLKNMTIGVGSNGKYNRLQLIPGTEGIEMAIPAGVNKMRGCHLNPATNEIIFFVWNSLGSHGIYLLTTANTISLIGLNANFETGLGLTENYWVHNIDTVDDLLYWCVPGRNPCRVNYRRLLDAEFTLPMAEPMYTTIRKPPIFPPAAKKIQASSVSITLLSNTVKDFAWRFAYRLVYKDNEESVLSIQSRLVAYNTDTGVEDIVEIKIPFAEKVAEDVKDIELIAISVPDETYNIIHTWNFEKDITAIANHNAGTTQLTYYYANDKTTIGVDQVAAVKPFDNVPRETGTQEIARDRLFYADNLMGYDAPQESSLAITLTDTDSSSNEFSTILNRSADVFFDDISYTTLLTLNNIISADVNFTMQNLDTEFLYTGTSTTNAKLVFQIIGTISKDVASPFRFSAQVDSVFYEQDILGQIFTLEAINQTFEIPINIDNNDLCSFNLLYPAGVGNFELDAQIIVRIDRRQASLTTDGNSLKSNSIYNAFIVFYDRWLRQCSIIPYSTFIQTAARAYGNANLDIQLMAWTVSNTNATDEIPTWAYYYGIGYSKQQGSFLQHYSDEIKYVNSKPETTLSTDDAWALTRYALAIKLSTLFNTGYGYTYTEGDIIFGYLEAGTPSSFSAEVIGTFGEYILVQPRDIGSVANPRRLVFDIVSPGLKNNIFYEVAQVFPVNNPGTSIRQYGVTGGVLPGDVYWLTQSFNSGSLNYEAMSPSVKNWKRWITHHGRLQVQTAIGEVYQPTGIRFSNVFLYGTRNNGLSGFEPLNGEQMPLSLGRIRKLLLVNKPQEEGTVLMAIGEAGRDTVSIYVGEQEINDVNGQVFLAKSDRVIGQVNALRGNYGTNHPESVANESGMAIWLDVAKGTVIQYASNGLQPVGKNKADSFWREWCSRQIQKAIPDPAPAVIDYLTGEYLIKLPAIDPSICHEQKFYAETERIVTYRIGTNRWAQAMDIPAEGMIMRDNVLITWYKGKPYTHTGSNYCWIYDRLVTPGITIPVNLQNEHSTKVFLWVEIVGGKQPVRAIATTNDSGRPPGQRTEIPAGKWEEIEGKWYAAFMKDMHTPGMLRVEALFNGRDMRGRVMLLTIIWSGGEGMTSDVSGAFIGTIDSIGQTV